MTLEEIYGNAKALVEDKTYQIGEISEKTGLQKTANGWVKPKSNKGNSSPKQEENKENGVEKKTTKSAQKELIKLEKERRSYGDDSRNDYAGHKIRLKQADLLNKAGFKDRKEFDKFYENQNKESENPYCRITADTKIRLKK